MPTAKLMSVVAVRSRVVVALCVLVAGCGGSSKGVEPVGAPATSIQIGPRTPTDPNRISAGERQAIIQLGSVASAAAPPAHHHDMSMMGAPMPTVPLSSAEQTDFDRQLAAAVAASKSLSTEQAATADGYVPASLAVAGIGTHWVKWSLIDKPFDPASPAMLLFDASRKPHRLVGFSYWVRSAEAPDGFAGPNDMWHQHSGLCVVNGWVDREMASGTDQCAGTYLAGSDLWMLHTWVVHGYANRWGLFAVQNPTLCPPAAGTPDIMRCPSEFHLDQ